MSYILLRETAKPLLELARPTQGVIPVRILWGNGTLTNAFDYNLPRYGVQFVEQVEQRLGVGRESYIGTRVLHMRNPIYRGREWCGLEQGGLITPSGLILDAYTLQEVPISTGPFEDPVQNLIHLWLQKCPYSNIFLHTLGSAVDFTTGPNAIPRNPDYLSIDDQITAGLEIPSEQQANVHAMNLIEREMKSESTYGFMYSYADEEDRATYFLSVNGKMIGSNNKRGISGCIKRAMKQYPGAPRFVHRAGSEVEFKLEERLMFLNVNNGMVERSSPRISFKELL